jgi:chemotaxis protein MotB
MPKITIKEQKSPLQEIWPPKWFFSYSDLATLMMTFFIILGAMLTLRIPLTTLASKKLRDLTKEETKRLAEISAITERQQKTLKEIEDLEVEHIDRIINLDKMRKFAWQINAYIQEQKLEDFVSVEEGRWNVRVTSLVPFLFERGRDTLRPEALPLLDRIGNFLRKYPSRIKIEGHTDNIPVHNPRFPSNWELSVARANSVMKYLLEKHNVPVEDTESIGYGEYRPVASNDTPGGRAKNRRVVIEITPKLKIDNLR